MTKYYKISDGEMYTCCSCYTFLEKHISDEILQCVGCGKPICKDCDIDLEVKYCRNCEEHNNYMECNNSLNIKCKCKYEKCNRENK